MADKTIIEQMLEHLVNGDKAKAEELFHEYVVATSREIYEGLIDSEIEEAQTEDDLEEGSEDDLEEGSEDDLEENYDEFATEGDDDKMPGSMDQTGDLENELDDEKGGKDDDEGDMDEPATKGDIMSVKDDVEELLAAFDEFKAQEEGEGHSFDGETDMDDMMGKNGPKMDSFDAELETVREYVEKVPAGHGAEKKGAAEAGGANTKSIIDNMKNDMGGTVENIVSGRNGADAGFQGMTGDLKGGALSKGKPQLQDGGNINVPGGKAGSAFNKKEPGHGAEKKGAGEQGGTNTTSLFRRK